MIQIPEAVLVAITASYEQLHGPVDGRPVALCDLAGRINSHRTQRAMESAILASLPESEVAGSIRDHRECGHWTTLGPVLKGDDRWLAKASDAVTA